MALEDEKYVLFTTFRKDGRAVPTPVWLVHLPSGDFAFSTGGESGKAKRLRHTPRVTVQGCDRSGGDLHGPVYEGDARLVSGAELETIRAAIQAKYGLMSKAIGVGEAVAKRFSSATRFNSERVGVVISVRTGAAE